MLHNKSRHKGQLQLLLPYRQSHRKTTQDKNVQAVSQDSTSAACKHWLHCTVTNMMSRSHLWTVAAARLEVPR